jgi:hypothetical protein
MVDAPDPAVKLSVPLLVEAGTGRAGPPRTRAASRRAFRAGRVLWSLMRMVESPRGPGRSPIGPARGVCVSCPRRTVVRISVTPWGGGAPRLAGEPRAARPVPGRVQPQPEGIPHAFPPSSCCLGRALMALPAVAQETDQATEQPEPRRRPRPRPPRAAPRRPSSRRPRSPRPTPARATETEATRDPRRPRARSSHHRGGDAAQAATEAPAEGSAPAGDPMQALSSARAAARGRRADADSAAIAVDGTTGTTTEGGTT